MNFEIWWDKNSGRSIQPNSNLKTACRYAYNDALMESGEKIKELEDKLKIAVGALDVIACEGEWFDAGVAERALKRLGELK